MHPADRPATPLAPDLELEAARRLAGEGRLAQAEQVCQRVLTAQPEHPEALRLLGNLAYRRGDLGRSVTLLSHASRVVPEPAEVLVELGIAYRDADRPDAARYVLERAVAVGKGRPSAARLLLAQVLENDRRPEWALLHYFRALREGGHSQTGRSAAIDAATPGALVSHARQFVAHGRRAWFERALQPLRHRSPEARWDRVDAALAIHLGERAELPSHPGMPLGPLHVPDLATSRFPDPATHSWLTGASEALAPCTQVARACVSLASTAVAGTRAMRLPVLDRGIPQFEAGRVGRELLAALDQLPLARIANIAPGVEIIALPAATAIPLQHGPANSRWRALVNLADSAPLQIVSGDERRIVAAAEWAVFDPGFGIACANMGSTPAHAVVLEIWHPDLSEPERTALTALSVSAFDFDQQLQDLT